MPRNKIVRQFYEISFLNFQTVCYITKEKKDYELRFDEE